MPARVKVILDINVFVAAHWAPSSASAQIIRACIEGRVQPQYTKEIQLEVNRTLRTIKARESFVRELEAFWERAEEIRSIPVQSVKVEDPEDQKFIEAAAGGDTDFLITNDAHLLRVGYIGRTEVLTPESAVKVLGL